MQETRRVGRARKKNGSRGDILQAATRLFADKGFDSVRIREISDAAGVGLPTIYHYFGDKRSLYKEVVLHEQMNAEKNLESALANVSNIENFRSWLVTLVDDTFERREFIRLMYRELLMKDEDLQVGMSSSFFQIIYDKMKEKLNELNPGTGDGILPTMLMATVTGYVTIYPYVSNLSDYAPALRGGEFVAAERAKLVGYLHSLLLMPETNDKIADSDKQDEQEELEWLRKAVVELTIDKMKMRAAEGAPAGVAVPRELPRDNG